MFRQTIAHFTTRIPTIQFRAALKGGIKSEATVQTGMKGRELEISVMDNQLPIRYKRKPLSSQEMESINTGGATSVVKYSK